jgi:hypothetical protein
MLGIISVTYNEPFSASVLFNSINMIEDKSKFKIYNFYNGASHYSENFNSFYYEKKVTENGGLALGYTEGIEYFNHSDVDFILFLNSDCFFDKKILEIYLKCTTENEFDFYYPILCTKNKKVSPFNKYSKSFKLYIISWILIRKELTKFICFPSKFWLDGIDYYLSEYFYLNNLKGKCLNIIVQHSLSVNLDYKSIPDWRILNIYKSEKEFLKSYYFYQLFKGIVKALIYGRFSLAIKLLKL